MNDLKEEKKKHLITRKKYEIEADENDKKGTKLRIANDLGIELKADKAGLESQLKIMTRKHEAKKQSFISITAELDMSNSVINELESAMEKQTTQRETLINEREVRIMQLKNEMKTLSNIIEENREENENRVAENKRKTREMSEMKKSLALAQSDKCELVEAMNGLREEGSNSLEMMESWLGGKSNRRFKGTDKSGVAAAAAAGRERRKTRKMSIFEQNIGETPPPINLKTCSDRLAISQADFNDDLRQKSLVERLGDTVSEDVKDIILESVNIKKIARRVDAAHANAMNLKATNFRHIMELKQCKKEFIQQEEHWKNVNISLSKAAREESAGLKRELNKKKVS